MSFGWNLLDARGKVLGPLAVQAAKLLMGKHKPVNAVGADDFVVVINARHVMMTGRKWEQKIYYKHSGYPGGLKQTKAKDMLAKRPETIIEKAVFGMLPDNRTRKERMRKLIVYPGEEGLTKFCQWPESKLEEVRLNKIEWDRNDNAKVGMMDILYTDIEAIGLKRPTEAKK